MSGSSGELQVVEDADGRVNAVLVLQALRQGAIAQLVAGRLADLLGLEDLDRQGVGRRPLRDGQVPGEDEARGHLVGVQGEVVDVGIDAVGEALQGGLLAGVEVGLDLSLALGVRLGVPPGDEVHGGVLVVGACPDQLGERPFARAPEYLDLEEPLLGLGIADAKGDVRLDSLLTRAGGEDVGDAPTVADDADAGGWRLGADGAGDVVGVGAEGSILELPVLVHVKLVAHVGAEIGAVPASLVGEESRDGDGVALSGRKDGDCFR